MRSRTRRKLAVVVTGAGFAVAIVAPSPAAAAVSCTYAGATDTAAVTLGAGADVATVRRNGNAIQANGVNCGAATVGNTDLIRIDGTNDSSQVAVIDLSGGALGPGTTAEGAGVSEIEIEVDLHAGGGERISVIGGTSADTLAFGTAGAKLNGDSDVDLTFAGLDLLELDGNAGNDTLSAGGSVVGTGSPLNKPSDIDGGAGADEATGGRYYDTIQGGTEADTIEGGQLNDTLKGGAGNDQVEGEGGTDYVDGDADADTLSGGQDTDYINYYGGSSPDGADVITGGPGLNDTLYLTSRVSNVIVSLDNAANDGADAPPGGAVEEGDNIKSDIEHVYTGSGNDTIDADFTVARTVGHTFDANFGNDKVFGGDETDSLYGDEGADTLDGGDSDDYLYAGTGADTLMGGDGEDNIYPDSDNDTINAGAGDDYMDGGPVTSGADSYLGGAGFDRVAYSGRTDDLDIVANNSPDDGTDVDGIPGGEEGDNVRADIERVDTGSGDDLISFASGPANTVAADNEVYSGSGNDTITVGLGADYVDAGEGTDKVTGGAGEDVAYGRGGADQFLMKDGFYDFIDGGAGDGLNDTGQFDSFDDRANFP